MSTKTTFKRVALVAVAALGLGVLSSVAPANATAVTTTAIVVGTVPPARAGVVSYVPVTLYFASGVAAGDTITVNAAISSAPISGGVANVASGLYTIAGSENNASSNAAPLFGIVSSSSGTAFTSGTNAGEGVLTSGSLQSGVAATGAGTKAAASLAYVLSATDVAALSKTVYVNITPDIAGTYSVLVSSTAATTKGYTAGDTSATFSITPGSAPSTVAMTTVAGGSILANSPTGALVKVTLTDAAGATSALSGNEVINVTTSGSGAVAKGHSTGSSYVTTTVTLGASDFVNGVAYVKLRDSGTAAETISLILTGSGTLSSAVTASKTFAVSAQAGLATSIAFEDPSTTSVYTMNAATVSTNALAVTALSSSQTWGFTPGAAPAATQRGYVLVTDTSGKITGKSGATYDLAYSLGAAALGGSVTIPAVFTAAGQTYTLDFPAPSTNFLGITSGVQKTITSTDRTNSAFTITPNSSFLAAPASAIALTATLKDQFGAARSGQTVTITTTGRNNPTATTAVTDASGKVTFTTADASTSTVLLADNVAFAASGATTKNVTINYANTAVGTVTVTGGNTTASVTAATVSTNDIAAGDGAEGGAQGITATVKDANGNALAGVPVTFTVAGTGVAFKSTSATVYTGTTGTATGSIYAWVAGTYTYTVTAGGKSTTGTITFGQSTATEARTISASVDGNVVTGKAVDRFGNPVAGVTLYATTTAPANIGGTFVATGTTDANGTAKWVVTNSGSVTVSAVNPASVAGTTFGQTCALAGNIDCAVPGTAATAFTASTAGTATTAETYVGASIAPAGVASAIVAVTADTSAVDTAQAAADAAAEATDAANAATDAANAAAEAADAATAAAQDAADAVAALSAQVADLISGLKAQLTALTNLVIKIQKKVKA